MRLSADWCKMKQNVSCETRWLSSVFFRRKALPASKALQMGAAEVLRLFFLYNILYLNRLFLSLQPETDDGGGAIKLLFFVLIS